jgi:hypothetical protein
LARQAASLEPSFDSRGNLKVVPALRLRRSLATLAVLGALASTGCKKPYRVGDHVLVEWEEGKAPYPAYVLEVNGKTRYRVHFEGYDSRWDEDVGIDRIVGRVEGPVAPLPPPEKVTRAAGAPVGSTKPTGAHSYQPGDRVRVTWRGSVYAAVVIGIEGNDRLLVHYEGHENAWDEVVSIDRVVSRRP